MDAAFMAYQCAWLGERTLANITLIRADVLVPHVVHDQGRAACEGLAAVAKLALIVCRIMIIVFSHFDFQVVVWLYRPHVHLLVRRERKLVIFWRRRCIFSSLHCVWRIVHAAALVNLNRKGRLLEGSTEVWWGGSGQSWSFLWKTIWWHYNFTLRFSITRYESDLIKNAPKLLRTWNVKNDVLVEFGLGIPVLRLR